jgi:hypothetical protein
MWSLGQAGMIEISRSLLLAAAADDLHEVTLLVGEAFGNSMIRNDVVMEPADDFSNMSVPNSFSELVKSPGGRRFLALSKVMVEMIGSLNATFAIRAILRMTTGSVDSILDPQPDSTLSSSLPVEFQEGYQGLEVEEVCVEACKESRLRGGVMLQK